MTRKLTKLALTAILTMATTLSGAQTTTVDGLNYSIDTTNGTATLTGRSSTTITEIVIPSTITYDEATYPVTTIRNGAFSGGRIDRYFNNITSVTFETPSNVTTIEKDAFYGTSFGATISGNKLTPGGTLTIPGSVASIGEGAFCWCGMSVVVMEDGEGMEKIGQGAFYDCPGLKSVTLPSKLESIAPFAFMWCTKITTLTLPEGLKYIGSFAFAFNYQLRELHMPSTLEHFGNSVLFSNYRLSDITIKPNCQYFTMGEGNEEGIIFNKDKTRLIFFSAEQQLLGRRYQYKVPTHVKEIGGGAFSGVRDELKSIVLPSTLELIDSFAFITNPLERITIPANTTLKVGAFPSECKEIFLMGKQGVGQVQEALKSVILYPCSGISSYYYGGGITATIYTKESLYDTYKNLEGTTIGSGNTSRITKVTTEIPATTTKQLTTMCRDFDVDLTDETLTNGVKAYIATGLKRGTITEADGNDFTGSYMTMKPINYIPSRTGNENNDYTGVVLLSEPGTEFKFKMGENDCFSTSQTTLEENNLLEGAPCYMHVLPTETDDDGTTYTCYGLNNGRFKEYGAEGTLSWNKAYLRLPIDNTTSGAKEFSFQFEDVTKLDPNECKQNQKHNTIHDLQGRKLNGKENLKPGLYIENGKKIIAK